MSYDVTQGGRDGVWIVYNCKTDDVIYECDCEYDARMRADELNDLDRAQDKLNKFRNRWNGEAAELLRMMSKTVTSALQKLETPLGHRAAWLRSLLEGNACDPCGKMYLLNLIGCDMAEDIGQLEPLEEDQIGAYDLEVEIMQDAIQEARDFINKFMEAEIDL